jgi:hypothetical protein
MQSYTLPHRVGRDCIQAPNRALLNATGAGASDPILWLHHRNVAQGAETFGEQLFDCVL